jgi:hypothetical protein
MKEKGKGDFFIDEYREWQNKKGLPRYFGDSPCIFF